ncbi:MAG: YjbH domain-containing protein [bacterium]
MRKFLLLSIVVVVTTLLGGSLAYATQSVWGPTGLIETPTAEVLSPGAFSIGANVKTDGGTIFRIPMSVGASYGVELGVTPTTIGPDTYILVNGKIQLIKEKGEIPAIAVGITDIIDQYKQSFYVVTTKTIGEKDDLKFNIGLGTGIYEGPFLGLNLNVPKLGEVIFEYSRHFNGGLRITYIKPVKIDIGFIGNAFVIGGSYSAQF